MGTINDFLLPNMVTAPGRIVFSDNKQKTF